MDNKVELLAKAEDFRYDYMPQEYTNAKSRIRTICRLLKDNFNAEKITNEVQSYIDSSEEFDRILYSEISNFIFSLEMGDRGMFATNIESLMIYVVGTGKQEVSVECRKMIIRIYDHSMLALNQVENVNNILGEGITDTTIKFKNEIKSVEREYISILGIFAAIVLTFVGGITFSSAVLQSMFAVSMYRLITVTILLAFVMVNVIWLLINFILTINDKNTKTFKLNIVVFDFICAAACVVVMIAWIRLRG